MRPPSFRPPSSGRVLAVATLAFLALAAPAQAGISPPEAHSPNVDDANTAYWVMFVITTILGLAAIAGLVTAYMRFRVRTHRDPREPRRLTAGRGVIARAAGGLGALALVLFVFGVVMDTGSNDAVAGEGDSGEELTIDVAGQQWLWRFAYPSEREDIATVFSYNELVVPVDTTVNLQIDSTDVMHRWWIPELGGQVQAVPGEITETSFRADEEGTYGGRSTEFAGTGYPAARAWVTVVSQDDYDTYVDQLADDIAEAQAAVQEEVAAGTEEGAP